MNKRDMMMKLNGFWKQYHVTGCNNYVKRPKNAVYLSAANSKRHEMAKASLCYDLLKGKYKFITEAVHNKTNLRHDVVRLNDGTIYEIETDPKRAARFKQIQTFYNEDIIVIPLWEKKRL